MLLDAISFPTVHPDRRVSPVASFLDFLEKKLGVVVSYDARDFPYGRPDLAAQFEFAKLLKEAGIISAFYPSSRYPDDPPYRLWSATCAGKTEMKTGGISATNDAAALTAAFAEALERYLWKETTDYFKNPIRASAREMAQRHQTIIAPERFLGFSKEQRAKRAELVFTPDTPFLWVEGVSLVSGKRAYVPSQTVSGDSAFTSIRYLWHEPMLRSRNTTGLATWTSRAGAQLNGAMECIERDAYMVMWLNQLTLPKLSQQAVLAKFPSLTPLIDSCERYRFKVHMVPLLTDAPAHAVMTVLEDLSPEPPRFAIGLRAHRSLENAIEKSLLEALRAHRSGRRQVERGGWNAATPTQEVGHYDRTHYWTLPEHAQHLEFLIAGKEAAAETRPWDNDTVEQHLTRIGQWCRAKEYECASIPLTASKKNPTKLHVEMIVMPELHPMHLYEKDLGTDPLRLQSVPKQFGFTPREEAFTERPHPFA